MKKTFAVSVGLALVLGFLGLFFPRSQPVTQNIVEKVVEKLGATPGADFMLKRISVGGVGINYDRVDAVPATTTPWTFGPTPIATSSLLSLGCNLSATGATTSAPRVFVITVATSTTRNATSTGAQLYEAAFPFTGTSGTNNSKYKLFLTATTSVGLSGDSTRFLLPPNTFINIGIKGTDVAASPVGACTAEYLEL